MAGLNRDERSWLRRARAGSISDLEELFRAHWPRAYRVSYLVLLDHALAEEIVQEVFLAATRTLDGFDGDRPFAPWLHQLVACRSLDAARGELARAQVSGESYVPPGGARAGAPPPYAAPEAQALFAGIVALPPEQRVVLVLRHLLDYSPGEIGELLEAPRSLVGSRLRRGRDSLREALAGAQLSEKDVRNLLLQQPVPNEHIAEERTWDVVRAAFVVRDPVPRKVRVPWKPIIVLALVGAGVAIGMSSAGSTIADQVRDWLGTEQTVGTATEPDAAAPLAVPGGGSVLAAPSPGVWAVEANGTPRRIGDYDGAAWSPAGKAILAWGDGSLAALDQAFPGDVRWSLEAADIHGARMTTDGGVVAYAAGTSVRVVEGDGSGDRELAAAAAPTVPAWRPGPDPVLAYADPEGRVVVVRPGGKVLWRTPRAPVPTVLEWSSDGKHVLAAAEHRIALFRTPRRLVASVSVPVTTGAVVAAAVRPGALAIAYAAFSEQTGVTTLSLLDGRKARVLLAVPGRLAGLAWSPDGERLLVGWEQGDQWLYVPVDGAGEVEVEAGITQAFRSDGDDASFPRVVGWCCSALASSG
ncbi:MAG: RNA polymerase sigma factor [Gaiellales bacterium]